MNVIQKIKQILKSATAKRVETYLVAFGGTTLKIVADSTLGKAILGAIAAGEAGTTPVEKIGLAIEALTPTIISYATGGGLKAVQGDAETVARLAIEQVLAQVKQTGPLAIVLGLEQAIIGK